MNHPKPEDWVPYLYGDANPDQARQLRAHLRDCPDCQRQFNGLKTTSDKLNAWKLPRTRARMEVFIPLLRWAAVGCVILLAGFMVGRISAKPDTAQIRAELMPELRRELRQEMAQIMHTEIDKASTVTLQAANDHADKVASAYAQTLYVALKKDVDTLALNADVGLRRTAERLVQLAKYQSDLPGIEKPQQ